MHLEDASVKLLRRHEHKESLIKEPRVNLNERIRAAQLRVIDADGTQLGILSRDDALARARAAELDLVEISPQADPPVAKIVDWGKFTYQKTKEAQKSRKKQVRQDLKQIRFGMKIGDNDFEIKMKKIKEFLEAGHKVRIAVFFRGRENAHKDLGYVLIDRVFAQIEDIAIKEQQPIMAGKQLSIVVRRK